MPDGDHPALTTTLAELRHAVGAEAADLYLDDGEGTLQLVASSSVERPRQRSVFARLAGNRADGGVLMLQLNGEPAGVVVVSRRSGDFTQQDTPSLGCTCVASGTTRAPARPPGPLEVDAAARGDPAHCRAVDAPGVR